jgi:CRISPR/Cas system-associated protein endoribonuclease Cas2
MATLRLGELLDVGVVSDVFSLRGMRTQTLIQRSFQMELLSVTKTVVNQWMTTFSDSELLPDLLSYLSGNMSITDMREKRHLKEWNMLIGELINEVVVNAKAETTLLTLYRIQLFIDVLKVKIVANAKP